MDAPDTQTSIAAIVLAGGAGERFGSPKYKASFLSKTLLDHAVDLVIPICDPVVVVLPEGESWNGPSGVETAVGGSNRAESLEHGLDAVGDRAEIVVVHDVIRPLATRRQIEAVVAEVHNGADVATLGWTPPDTVKSMSHDGKTVHHVGRENLRITHGPTAAKTVSLRAVITKLGSVGVEETIGVEQAGGVVKLVEGDRWSNHIVTTQDLRLAELVAIERSRT